MDLSARLRNALLLLPAVAGALIVFLPVTEAYFHRDDFLHLVAINNHPLTTIIWRPFMGHLYSLPRLVYAALLGAVGPTPAPYFWLLLTLHLLNVGLLFSLVRHLTGSARLASVGALAWGSSVFHTMTLSYFCLHAHVLVGLALLLILRGLAVSEASGRSSVWQAAGWAVLGLGASLSYGTGLVLALALPFLALLIRGRLPARLALPLGLLPVAVVGIYVRVRAAGGDGAYGARRLEAGLRASLADPWSVLAMWANCGLYGLSALASIVPGVDTYPAPTGAAVGAVLALLLAHAAARRSSSRAWILALILFAAGCYAVAAVAPAYERQIFRQVEVVRAQDHRYHYAPGIALALAVALALGEHARRLAPSARVADLVWAGCTALLLTGAALDRRPIDLHAANRVEVAQVLEQARRAAAAAPLGSTVELDERPFRGGFGFWRSTLTNAGIVSLFHPSGELDGRSIRYRAAPDRAPLDAAAGSPLARVIVPAPTEEPVRRSP